MPDNTSRQRGGDSSKRPAGRSTTVDATSTDSGAGKATSSSKKTVNKAVKNNVGTTEGNKKKSTAKKTTAKASRRKATKATSSTESKAGKSSNPVDRITGYPGAVRWLFELNDVERQRVVKYDAEGDFKLDRMRNLLTALGDPQQQFRSVHVAGTNGKGSTVAMISAMLQRCGYAVGSFTSPHLTDVRERVSINGQMIARPEFTELMRKVAEASVKTGEAPTFFEAMTAIGFLHFAEQAVDVALVEVGLGGRLDSTNVIVPVLGLITEIQHDHTRILGTDLASIATEKAGIMKPGVPVITREQEESVEGVLTTKAEEVGTTIRFVNREIEFSNRFCSTAELGPHNRVCLYTETSRLEHLPVPLPGEHQAFNCGLALAAVDHLKSIGFDCPEAIVTAGLGDTVIRGRMELVWERPRILVDGAHNPESLGALMRCVGAHVPYDSMVCVFGCGQDKDVESLLDRVSLGADKVIFTRASGNPRACDPEDLRRRFMERSGKMCQTAGSVGDALELAARAVSRDDLICVTGSFYLVGEAVKHLEALRKSREETAAT
ncbi:MAG: bifunctional folylpolyglutamate synthase/dihydrofolate synthase [Phycisphaera sp.]|nr:bifunctional folylpolyglutamate synthase/dihydrofolate synthase [Phycisphaera sp.]